MGADLAGTSSPYVSPSFSAFFLNVLCETRFSSLSLSSMRREFNLTGFATLQEYHLSYKRENGYRSVLGFSMMGTMHFW